MKWIRFRRIGAAHWEVARDEKHLQAKLGSDLADVRMPAKPWYVRLWRMAWPLRMEEISS